MSNKDKSRLKRNLRTLGEKKYVVNQFSLIPVNDSGTITSVTDIIQGDGDSNRDGDQVGIRSIQIMWASYIPEGIVNPMDDTNTVRIILVQWFPTTVPNVNNILFVPSGGQVTLSPIMPYNHDNRFNFKILYDKIIPLTYNGPNLHVGRRIIRSGFKEKIQYQSASTTGTNKIYLIMISDSSAPTHPVVDAVVKFNYNDY